MRLVFRADASFAIGSGHVMRSSAIAEESIARSFPTVFVGTIADLQWVSERIHGLGFTEIVEVNTEFISDPNNDILILDSYEIAVDDNFIQPSGWKAVVSIFDELTPEYKSDLRVHTGLTNSWPIFTETKTLGGPEYVPLRKSIKKSGLTFDLDLPKIIVVGGGSDATEFVSAISRSLARCKFQFNAILFTTLDESLALDNRFTVVPIGKDLDDIANTADLVFTTASTTSLEFIARGCAVAIGCAVDNQEQYYKELSKRNFAAPIGKFFSGEWHLKDELIKELVDSSALRAKLRRNSNGLIDLNGAKRIVDEILKL
jgi:spore coat polysaccharide biosynthesis predicted glycosyltransferase SpsG